MNVYRRWAGSPNGEPEDLAYCAAEVPDGGRSPLAHQCGRKRGHGPHGLLCKQHAQKIAAHPDQTRDKALAWMLPHGYVIERKGSL